MKTPLKQRTYDTYQQLHFAATAYGLRDMLRESPKDWHFMKDGVRHVWVKAVTPKHTPEEIAELDRTTDVTGNSYSDAEGGL